MAPIRLFDIVVDGVASSWTALGTWPNGSSLVHIASDYAHTSGNLVRIKTDPAYDPYLVVGNAEGECGRLRIKPGVNPKFTAVGTLETGVVGDEFDALYADVTEALIRIRGRFKHDSGSPSSIMHLGAGYLPAQATVLPALLVGPSLCTPTALNITALGSVAVADAVVTAPTATIDVVVDGSYQRL